MVVAGAIEPRVLAEVDAVDHQRVAVPAAARITHPPVDVPGGMGIAVHVDLADGVVVFVEDVHLVGLLHDLERERHERDARHAREITLRFRIERRALRFVLFLLRQRLRFIRQLVSRDHAFARGHAEPGAVILKVPRGGVEDLPDSLDVGVAVSRLWRRIRRHVRRRLGECGRRSEQEHHHRENPILHGTLQLRASTFELRTSIQRSDLPGAGLLNFAASIAAFC